jgi:hypothetical protein
MGSSIGFQQTKIPNFVTQKPTEISKGALSKKSGGDFFVGRHFINNKSRTLL